MENRNLLIGVGVAIAVILLFLTYGHYRKKPADTQPPAQQPSAPAEPVPVMLTSVRPATSSRIAMPEWDV